MEIEQKQAQLIDHFVKQASTLQGSSLVSLIVQLTSHNSLFAFSEILAVPNVLQLQGTEYAVYIDMLRLFAHGTWSDYKSNASLLPPLVPDQINKLKQLTVLSLAEANKVLSYDQLLEQLDLSNVRELEDFLINECMYMGIIKGKLDHLKRSVEVQFAAGRDLKPGQLGNIIETLTDWLATTDNVLLTIEEKIKWADKKCELNATHQKEVKDRVEEVKKSLSHNRLPREYRVEDFMFGEPAGLMDYEEDRTRMKRRRSPRY
ncbi:COP9 signalosome complex subunit 7 isoform X1 [Rosa chinensis]|uniref:COP9 signalosome complex subunit 7 isoform X1 n=1 Tax=Rosa chinensis TaxID=74649 RepID=UPI000D0907E4|nr:COP9 signalosome complex subunit 7 isoform X1 [Rosa chinensis]